MMMEWWRHALFFPSSHGDPPHVRSTREGLKLSRQCFDVHLVQDMLAKQGHVSHDRERDVLHILLESLAHAARN
jgi:hypothetical protein